MADHAAASAWPRRLLVVVAGLALVGGIGWNALQAWRQGFAAEGDTALITLRVHDVGTKHASLVGSPTTAGTTAAQDAFHPGPIEFYALALPLHAWLPAATGLLVGTFLVNAAALALLVWFAHRRRGPPGALAAALFGALLVAGLGEEIPHDVYNPHIVLLPLALLVVLVWSIVDGDRVAIPVAVITGSFIAQAHGYEALTVAGLGALAVVGLFFERKGTTLWWWLVGSVPLAVLVWLPPIIDQLTNKPGNLSLLWDQARSPSNPPEGLRFALDSFAFSLTPPFRWLERQPTFFDLHERASTARIAVAMVIVLVLAGLGVVAWRTGRRATARMVAIAVGGVAVSIYVTSRLPQGIASASPYNHRHWWITGLFAWCALAFVVADLLRTRLPALLRSALPVVALVGVVAVTVVTAAHVNIGEDRDSFSFGALNALTGPVARAVQGKGTVMVSGAGQQAFFSIEPGLVEALVVRGIDARVQEFEGKAFGPSRVGGSGIKTWVYVVSGPGSDTPPPGTTLIARYDARDDYDRGFTNTGLAGQAEVIAVYIGPPQPPLVIPPPNPSGGG